MPDVDDTVNAVVLQDQLRHLKTLCSISDSHPAFDYAEYTHSSYIADPSSPIDHYPSLDAAMGDVMLFAAMGIQIYLTEIS
jgi:hypothetical protein